MSAVCVEKLVADTGLGRRKLHDKMAVSLFAAPPRRSPVLKPQGVSTSPVNRRSPPSPSSVNRRGSPTVPGHYAGAKFSEPPQADALPPPPPHWTLDHASQQLKLLLNVTA